MSQVTLSKVIGESGIFIDGDWVESKDQDVNGNVRLIQLADVGDGFFINKSYRFLTTEKAQKLKCTYLKADDILIARMPDPLGRACVFPGLGTPAVTVVDVCIVRPDPRIADINWLKFLINTPLFRSSIKQYIKGTTRQRISRGNLEKIKFHLPPLSEQLHIANLLSKAENLIAQRKECIRLLDEFLKGTFLEMFGDPVRNERGWEEDKVISYTDCIVPGRDKPKSFTGSIPWFTTEDLLHKGYVTKSKKGLGLSMEEIKEVRARVIPAGSVLITCVGDLGIISVCKEDCVVNQQLHAFICKENINNLFLMYSLSFQINFMYNKATSTTVPYMNKTTCNSIPVILPPYPLQSQFARIVEKTEALKIQYQQSLYELENLYGSLSQRAFRGELKLIGIAIEI